MPKLAVLNGNEVCALLAEHGFVEVRRRGSHIIMQRQGRWDHDDCARAGS